jgi:propanediol dehydratase small subunit
MKMAIELNEELVAELVRQVIKNGMTSGVKQASEPEKTGGKVNADDYPLASKRPDLLVGPRGKSFEELTLSNIMNGKVGFEDFKITPQALECQAQVAESTGRPQISRNLRRAAELTRVGDERILEIYNALRPHRSTKEELLAIAEELETKYGAMVCGGFVKEAAEVYQRRKLLRGDIPTA